MSYFDTALYVDSVQYTAVATWTTGSKSVGAIIRQLTTPAVGSERCFVCVVAGSAGGSEPVSWTTTRGGKTTDNAVTWQECSGVAALNGDATSTPTWNAAKSNSVTIGAVIKNVAGTFYFICTTAGTAGSGSEPSWTLTAGVTTADNTVTWTCLGAIGGFTSTWKAPIARLSTACSSSWSVTSGAYIYVGDDHAETASTQLNIANNFQTNIICVDHTVAVPPTTVATTATVTDTSSSSWTIFSSSYVYCYGITFYKNNSGSFNIAQGSSSVYYFSNCVFKWSFAGSQSVSIGVTGSTITFDTCTLTCAFSSNTIPLAGALYFKNCTVNGTTNSNGFNDNVSRSLFYGCDFSLFTNLASATTTGGYFAFKNCKIKSGYTMSASGIGTIFDIVNCDSGATNYNNARYTNFAAETTSTSIVRTGGASDGTTAVSHKIVTTSNLATSNLSPGATYHPAISLAIWNSVLGTNRTVTLYGLVNSTVIPKNDEVWFDVEYLGSSLIPQATIVNNFKANVLATGASGSGTQPIADSTSAWDSAATAWQSNHAYSLGDIIKASNNSGRIFFCTSAGTSTNGAIPAAYGTAVDGGVVTDNGATFRAGCRFSMTITLSGVQPAQVGYLYAHPKFGRASSTYFIDPEPYLS